MHATWRGVAGLSLLTTLSTACGGGIPLSRTASPAKILVLFVVVLIFVAIGLFGAPRD
jgi:hypothetical protein